MTTERIAQIEMLVKYYNMKAGTRIRTQNEANQNLMDRVLTVAENNVQEVRTRISRKIAGLAPSERANANNFSVIMQEIESSFAKEKPAVEIETPAPVAPEATNTNAQLGLEFMQNVIVDLLAKTKLDSIETAVASKLENHVREFISANYGTLQRKIEVQLPERKVELSGVLHEKFEEVLKFVMANEPVFLTGPAGSGKNVICQQVAKTLGLNFYFSNAVTQEYKITGFTDAMGVYQESQFYKAFKNGGLFMLDEMDASIPEVLIILNAAIANRYFDFPAPIGYVEAHPDFRVIAAGNTFGAGADYDYVGRNQLDAASLDRFGMVRIDYDKRIEENCANGDMELLDFCRKFRNAIKEAGIRTVVSYRAISRLAKLSKMLSAEDLLESCLLKALEVDDLNAIASKLSGCGKYSNAFVNVLNARKRTA